MTFDTNSDKIIVIHYPPGGFGNFLFYVLTEFAEQTVKFDNSGFKFGSDGNSHSQKKYTNTYFHNPEVYEPTINSSVDTQDRYILVLSDNGFEYESLDRHKIIFPNARFVKVVLDDLSTAVCYKTLQVKAMHNPTFGNGQEIIDHHKQHFGKITTDYEIREHYSIMYHKWTLNWNSADPLATNVMLTELIASPFETITKLINLLGLTVIDADRLKNLCEEWLDIHTDFFNIYHQWQRINTALDQNQSIVIEKMNLHDQGYINYCIEKKYNITIPVYDYKNWFASTADILRMIEQLS